VSVFFCCNHWSPLRAPISLAISSSSNWAVEGLGELCGKRTVSCVSCRFPNGVVERPRIPRILSCYTAALDKEHEIVECVGELLGATFWKRLLCWFRFFTYGRRLPESEGQLLGCSGAVLAAGSSILYSWCVLLVMIWRCVV
jgi:hypothetical protein